MIKWKQIKKRHTGPLAAAMDSPSLELKGVEGVPPLPSLFHQRGFWVWSDHLLSGSSRTCVYVPGATSGSGDTQSIKSKPDPKGSPGGGPPADKAESMAGTPVWDTISFEWKHFPVFWSPRFSPLTLKWSRGRQWQRPLSVWMTCSMITGKHCWKNFKKTQIIEMTHCVHGLEDLIMLLFLYDPKWSTDSVQDLSKALCYFHIIEREKHPKIRGATKHAVSQNDVQIEEQRDRVQISSLQNTWQRNSNPHRMVLT